MSRRACTEIEYMYRDPHNFKFCGSFVVGGTVTKDDLEEHLFGGTSFAPTKIGLNLLLASPRKSYDHEMHEITAVRSIECDQFDISVDDFLRRFAEHTNEGWL